MLPFLTLILAIFVTPVFAQPFQIYLRATAFAIPYGDKGIGFDDLIYSSDLNKVLVPAGHTGKVYIVDPKTYDMKSISGFSSSDVIKKGHEVGVSSADEGEGFLFAADHGTKELIAVDLKSGAVAASAKLAGDADYVRYIGGGYHEVWVTEPHDKQMEVFKFTAGGHPTINSIKTIVVPKGPESLMVDHIRGFVYTNLGPNAAAISLDTHAIVTTWPNECTKSRGDALDEQKGFLFVSCSEGKAIVFDLNNNDKEISNLATDAGPDVISYNSKLSHLYFTSPKKATLSVIGVSAQGKLTLLGQAPTDVKAHCVVGDDQNNIWVCDPPRGQLLRYKDTF